MGCKKWSVKGKVAIVTGASSGLGKISAEKLASLGARLYLVCRDEGRAKRTANEIVNITGNKEVHILIADLSSQQSIRSAAQEFLSREKKLHLLLNNAGAIFGPKRRISIDGIELTFALNHLSYFSLTLHLIKTLIESAPSRIVNVASDGYTMGGGRFCFDDYNAEKKYSFSRQYGQSKLANILFTKELSRRLQGTCVTVNSASPPGLTATKFGHNTHPITKYVLFCLRPFINSELRGAESQITLCTEPNLGGVSGEHFSGYKLDSLRPEALNETDAARLWALSEELTDLKWPTT